MLSLRVVACGSSPTTVLGVSLPRRRQSRNQVSLACCSLAKLCPSLPKEWCARGYWHTRDSPPKFAQPNERWISMWRRQQHQQHQLQEGRIACQALSVRSLAATQFASWQNRTCASEFSDKLVDAIGVLLLESDSLGKVWSRSREAFGRCSNRAGVQTYGHNPDTDHDDNKDWPESRQ